MAATPFAEQADSDLRAVEDDPAQRLEFARDFFVHHPQEGITRYGVSELAFMEWEVRRRCLDPLVEGERSGSEWWRSVNGGLLRDAREAHLLFDAGHTSSDGLASNPSVRHWQEFIEHPDARSWYLAHNSSIARGYVRYADLAAAERGHEQKLMNLVLYRVLFTQAVVDQQPWTFGWISRWLSRFVSPTSKMVTYVVHRRDLYPQSYQLSKEDCRRLERRGNHLGDVFVSLVDLSIIAGQLPRLYDYAASTLEVPELRHMTRHRLPCYPWGLRMHPNELEAIATTDKPSMPLRVVGWAVHGVLR